ncbi:MAG: hypothetical protein RLZZ370_1407 [Bacteroidota bacterium]|jgi:hypothetical protein
MNHPNHTSVLRLLLVPALFFMSSASTTAQVIDTAAEDEVEVFMKVGDLIQMSDCEGSEYRFVEIHRKTRTTRAPGEPRDYDTTTGEGFFDWFFREGDFDSMKMPCSMSGKSFQILSMQTFSDQKTGAARDVLFLKVDEETVAWVEFYPATEAGEIIILL